MQTPNKIKGKPKMFSRNSVYICKTVKYNTGRSSELHYYAIDALISFKGIIQVPKLQGEEFCKVTAGTWRLCQNASQLLWKRWVTFACVTPSEQCAHVVAV